jgi:hypothetical protein
MPLHGNEALRQRHEVMGSAPTAAEQLRDNAVRDESETPAAVITALHVNPPMRFCCCRLLQWPIPTFSRCAVTVSNEGEGVGKSWPGVFSKQQVWRKGRTGAGRRPVRRTSEQQEGEAGHHGTTEQNRPIAQIETKQAAIADYVGHHRYPLFSQRPLSIA